MKIKRKGTFGKQYLFITPENNTEEEFIFNFFNSPDDIEEKLTLKAQGHFSEFILSKAI